MSTLNLSISDRAKKSLEALRLWYDHQSLSETIDFLAQKYTDSYIDTGSIDIIDQEHEVLPVAPSTPGRNEIIEHVRKEQLAHTKPISAVIGEQSVGSLPWKDVLIFVFRNLIKKGVTADQIVSRLTIAGTTDDSLDHDYPHDPESNITFSPQATPRLWEEVCNLAYEFDLAVEVKFRWTDNRKATYPNRIGIVRCKRNKIEENRKIKVLLPDTENNSNFSHNAPKAINAHNADLLYDSSFLKKTKVTGAKIGNRDLHTHNWSDLFKALLIYLDEKLEFTVNELMEEVEIKIVEGEFDDEHFAYIEKLDCSVEYKYATVIAKELIRLGNKFDIPIEVHFHWPNHSEARFPSESSILIAGSDPEKSNEENPS